MNQGNALEPTFLIAGMQKAGTTTLHALLATYPEIYMPSRKELHLFSTGEVTPERFSRYLDWFADASDPVCQPESIHRLSQLNSIQSPRFRSLYHA